jgi:chemotaxis protein MotB
MLRVHHWIGLSILSLALTGCVSEKTYQAVRLERDQLAAQLTQATQDLARATSEADAYKKQLDQLIGTGQTGQALVANLTQQNADLQRQLGELTAKLEDALRRGGVVSGPLPVELSNALRDFAAQNPDLVDFDSARGIVKFKSDVTFAVGDAELTPKAREVIGRFATILNSSAASGYELVIAGHTDSTRVVNPATIAKGHKDNWYLSAHRSISVAGALISQSVSPNRLAVTGYADQRPIASNGSDSGRAQNRRVEVIILPTTVVKAGTLVPANTVTGPHKAGKATMNKDTVVAPKPAPKPLNKD